VRHPVRRRTPHAWLSGLLTLALLGSLSSTSCTDEKPSFTGSRERIERLRTFPDDLETSKRGLNDFDMATNGEELIARTLIDANDTVFDVGAHLGKWSRYVVENQPTVRIYAFEPAPHTFRELEKNAEGTRITPVPIALSDEEGVAEFQVYGSTSQLNSFYHRAEVEQAPWNARPVSIEVPTQRLDAYCKANGIERIEYLKIDTEGAELLILRGSTGLLKNRSIGIVQFEYASTFSDAGITLEEVFALLTSHEYDLYRILPDGVVPITAWRAALENEQYTNYLAVAP
jgi:FkbM family methyltransferase